MLWHAVEVALAVSFRAIFLFDLLSKTSNLSDFCRVRSASRQPLLSNGFKCRNRGLHSQWQNRYLFSLANLAGQRLPLSPTVAGNQCQLALVWIAEFRRRYCCPVSSRHTFQTKDPLTPTSP
jgi:hypothetical protein